MGDDFASWLRRVKDIGVRGPIIVNTKEDGLEERCTELLADFGITNYFFLDTALPTLVRWTTQKAESRFAVRLSAFEPSDYAKLFAGKAEWLWVDCFNGQPVDGEILQRLKNSFKICLVSPELQIGLVPDLQHQISRFSGLSLIADAVCTKVPDYWARIGP